MFFFEGSRFCLAVLVVKKLDRFSASSVLCPPSGVVIFKALFKVARRTGVEGFICTSENIDEVGHKIRVAGAGLEPAIFWL